MKYGDRVKETSTTATNGDFTLAGAVATFVTFTSIFALGERFGYVIDGGTEWEVGIGYLSGTTTLVRETVTASTNSGALVTFSAGTKNVFCDITADYITKVRTHGQIAALATGQAWP